MLLPGPAESPVLAHSFLYNERENARQNGPELFF